jgi:hypothetical protein
MEHPAVAFQRRLRKASVSARLSYGVDLPSCAPLTVQMSHRKVLYETLFDYAFKHGGQTTLLTIKSAHTPEVVKQRLPDIISSGTQLDILTVDPSGAVGLFDAIAQHLGVTLEEVANDVRNAWDKWNQLASLAPSHLKVFCFSSLPVWQGYVVGEKYAVIELLPCGSLPGERPAIIALNGINGEAFELFVESVRRIPRSPAPVSRQKFEVADEGVARHAIYTQLYTEFRRYRDYELQTCTRTMLATFRWRNMPRSTVP